MFLEDLRDVQARMRRRSWRRWAACRPASRTRSATRWPRSRRPTRCWTRTAPTPAQRQLTRMVQQNASAWRASSTTCWSVARRRAAAARRDRRRRRWWPRICADWARTDGLRQGSGGVLRWTLPAQPVRRALRCRAPAARAGQPARQRARATPATRRTRSGCTLDGARRAPGRAAVWQRRRAARSRRSAPPVRALLLTRSRGSGLGLYICRELCERHGATHRLPRSAPTRDEPEGNEFFVLMRRGRCPPRCLRNRDR